MCIGVSVAVDVDLLLLLRFGLFVLHFAYLCQDKLDKRVLIVAKHCLINEACVDLINRDDKRPSQILINRKLSHAKRAQTVLVSDVIVHSMPVVVAYRRDIEEL